MRWQFWGKRILLADCMITRTRFPIAFQTLTLIFVVALAAPPPLFQVTPVTGTLERRGGPPQDFQITYLGDGTPGTTGHLIVMTEEEKFTFELVVP